MINGTGGGSYSQGQDVTISANNLNGYTFTEWTSDCGDIFNNKAARSTTFTMPGKSVTITANYSKDSSGENTGGGNSDSGGLSEGGSSSAESGDDDRKDEEATKDEDTTKNESTTTVLPTKEPNSPTRVIASTGSTVTKDTENVTLSKSTVKDAIKKAQEAAEKNSTDEDGISVEIKVDTKNVKASNLSTDIPKSTLEELTKAGVKDLRINSDVALISLDLETLKTIQAEIGGDLNLSAKKVDKDTLSQEVKEMPNSLYDEKKGIISFDTDHFSQFAIGYKEDKEIIRFTDILNHWAKDHIEFVTVRGLFTGTGEDKFSPNISMTRGMFVTVLGRLDNADVSSYKDTSFTDLKSDAYHMPYVEWASDNRIVSGISQKEFAPDMEITRQQMAVILYRYSKYKDYDTTQGGMAIREFEDYESISDYALPAMGWTVNTGLIQGSNMNIMPKESATRAQIAAILKRFIETIKE